MYYISRIVSDRFGNSVSVMNVVVCVQDYVLQCYSGTVIILWIWINYFAIVISLVLACHCQQFNDAFE